MPRAPLSFPAFLIVVAGTLGSLLLITGRAQSLVDGVPHLCQSLRLCSPTQPGDIQPFNSTNWVAQSSFDVQVANTLSTYRAKYPDFDIQAHQTGEDETDDPPFHSNVRHKYHGDFIVKPKWEGLFGIIGDKLGLSENAVAWLFVATVVALLIGFFWPRPPRQRMQPAS